MKYSKHTDNFNEFVKEFERKLERLTILEEDEDVKHVYRLLNVPKEKLSRRSRDDAIAYATAYILAAILTDRRLREKGLGKGIEEKISEMERLKGEVDEVRRLFIVEEDREFCRKWTYITTGLMGIATTLLLYMNKKFPYIKVSVLLPGFLPLTIIPLIFLYGYYTRSKRLKNVLGNDYKEKISRLKDIFKKYEQRISLE